MYNTPSVNFCLLVTEVELALSTTVFGILQLAQVRKHRLAGSYVPMAVVDFCRYNNYIFVWCYTMVQIAFDISI
jgi:hypothetical protein